MLLERNTSLKFYSFLRPLSCLYGMVVGIRNKLYDSGILRSTSFPLPVICVGNISVGGTGKTPHIEYILKRLSDKYRIAVISRGYKRKTKGFHWVKSDSSALETGDESLQIKNKFPHVTVAVDADRNRGIERLMNMRPKPDFILMDDGFQHRSVKPSFVILLTDYNRLFYLDRLLPEGQLREHPSAKKRADVVVVTKCSDALRPIDYALLHADFNLIAQQELFFSKIKYGVLQSVFGNFSVNFPEEKMNSCLLITGIANTTPLKEYIADFFIDVEHLKFPDHHAFELTDVEKMVEAYKKKEKCYVITTEKDAVRLRSFGNLFPEQFKNNLFYLPIEPEFIDDEGEELIKLIEKHINSFIN